MIIGIVAAAQNLAIGKDGKLPWHYAADLKFFKQTTTGNVVVMGRKTFESIGRPLPNRLNLVLSRSAPQIVESENLKAFATKKELLEFIKKAEKDVYIIGGASIYTLFADDIEKWLVTEIPQTVADADVKMKRDFLDGFSLTETNEIGENLVVKTFLRR